MAVLPADDAPLVTLQDVQAAAVRIADACVRTPVLAAGTDLPLLWLKADSLQPTGAFKLRGATNAVAVLDPEVRTRGVVTHSSGNHGQALACAAARAGIACTVVMPEGSVAAKVAATRAWGATVELVPTAERASTCAAIAERTGAGVVPPFDDAAIIAGQGTVGLEILDQLPGVATVLVPVGGGGLISGIAAAVKGLAPQVRVIGVEPELAADAAEGMRTGRRTQWPLERTTATIADGLRGGSVGILNWAHLQAQVDGILTVGEAQIVAAVGEIAGRARLVAEPSGAVTTAAYLAHRDRDSLGPTVAVVSGGNVDPVAYADMLGASVSWARASVPTPRQ
ncbi:MAG: threonine/serine dehydratase [Actinomycetota bacterium]|nr:threonine/serine dehydratase [Actinomycetota bacterium]